MEIISSCLETFCASFEQKFKRDKTRIFFSENIVQWQVKEKISNALGFRRTTDLDKYLGVRLQHQRVYLSTYHGILERATQHLSSWKSRNLSLMGCLTLAKSVLAALPSYSMKSSLMTISICEDVHRVCRNLIWGDTPNKHRVHLLAWEDA